VGFFCFMPFYTYKLYSKELDRNYIGSCVDIDKRLNEQHNTGRNPSTIAGIPWQMKYTELFNTRAEAMARETVIKNKKKQKIY
jgi:putative endonuclease